MLGTDDEIYSNNLPLLTLKGLIAIYFLDGNVLEGEFASQDIFNVFLLMNGEPVMIPRSQIRFIMGRQGQSIEADVSSQKFKPVILPQAVEQGTPIIEEAKEIDEEEEDTLVFDSEPVQPTAPENELADDDSTVILPLDDETLDIEEDSGTVILASTLDDGDETDTTMVVDLEAFQEEEADDTTVLLGQETKGAETSATLLCTSGPHTGDTVKLKSGITTIGRSGDNVIVLNRDKEISRHHAIILQESGRFVIQDQNSLNGTFVNDEQVTAPRYLADGDVILVGVSTFRYQEG